MSERKKLISGLDKDKEYKFFSGDFKYQGHIKGETSTHFIIKDNFKKRIFHLPKRDVVIEEVED